jgi:PAS domain S-box-containing protein
MSSFAVDLLDVILMPVYTIRKSEYQYTAIMPTNNHQPTPTAHGFEHEGAEQYRLALKNAPIVFARVDSALRYEWIYNPHPDFDPAALLGKRGDEVDAGPGIDALVALKQDVLVQGVQMRQEITFTRSDGMRTYDVTATPIKDEAGQVTHIITASLDITPRVQVEEALRASERQQRELAQALEAELDRLAVILDHLPAGVWLADQDGRLIMKNQESDRIWNGDAPLSTGIEEYPQYEAWYAHSGKRLLPEEYPVAKALRTGEPVEPAELQIRRFDGTEGTIFVSAVPIKDRQGLLTGAVGINVDITRRTQAEDALRAQTELTQTILENSTACLVMMDACGYCTYMNRAGEQMFGWTFEEIRQKPLHDMIHHHHPDGRPYAMAECPIDRALPENFDIREHEDWFIRRNGEFFPVLVAASPIFDDTGRAISTVIEVRDVTERKQTEESLRQINESLEARVEERSREVRYLVTQLTMTEQAERRRISQILHDDLQQRLYSLNFQLGFLRSALDSGDRETVQQLIAEFEESLQSSVQITRELSIDFSPSILHNEGLLEAVRWLAVQMQQRHGLVVTLQTEERLPRLHEDLRVLLFQIVRELLFNVVKHAGVLQAGVSLTWVNGLLRIEVSDQGKGFDVNGVTATPERSNGLLQVRRRLELLGGRVEIESQPEHGARVILYYPLPREDA